MKINLQTCTEEELLKIPLVKKGLQETTLVT